MRSPLSRFQEIVDRIHYRNWRLAIREDGSRLYLQVQFDAPCAATGHVLRQHGRKWMLSPHMTVTEVVRTAFKACLAAEEHECQENFRYRGVPIFSPHLDVELLAEMWRGVDPIDVRPEPPRPFIEIPLERKSCSDPTCPCNETTKGNHDT